MDTTQLREGRIASKRRNWMIFQCNLNETYKPANVSPAIFVLDWELSAFEITSKAIFSKTFTTCHV